MNDAPVEIVVSYPNVIDLKKTLLRSYPFHNNQQWSGDHIIFPQMMGEGEMNLFEHSGLQFMRGIWKFSEPTTFRSPNPVGTGGLIDFRIGQSGEVRSAYLEGCKMYEWDISIVKGMRLMVPAGLVTRRKTEILDKFQRYTYDVEIKRLLRDLFEAPAGNFLETVKMEWKFLELSYNWLQYINNRDISQNFRELRTEQIRAIEEATEIINFNLRKPPSIKELSKLVGLNQQYLKTGFKKHHGVTLRQYLIKQRMTKAKQLIVQDCRPIAEVSNMVGYENASYFARVYKKFYGVCPLNDRNCALNAE